MALRQRIAGFLVVGVLCAIALPACQDVAQLMLPSYETQLAEYLTETGAKMYGAYWCPHCARQKQLFGQAAHLIPYIECDPRGANANVDLCQTIGIAAYPTWQINGKFYLGAQPLKRLAMISGFETAIEEPELDNDSWGGFSPVP